MAPGANAAARSAAETLAARPRFRAEHIGDLLRPDALEKVRATRGMDPEALAGAEDAAIARAVAMQQDIGLPAVTDGGFRCAFGRDDFMGALTGMALASRSEGGATGGAAPAPVRPIITDRIAFPDDHPMLAHFRALASVAQVTPKVAIPSPGSIHRRVAEADIALRDYRDEEVLFADLTCAYRCAVAAFHAAGCRYLQFDDTAIAALCDPVARAQGQAKDCNRLISRYAAMIDAAIADRPADMTMALHLCRGALAPADAAAGGDDRVAEAAFSTGADVVFMAFDSDRPDRFAPLRLLPKGGMRVMPGLVSTVTPHLEKIDALRRAFDAASRFAELDQLGLAPRSGFSATGAGDPLTEDDQKRKLDLVVRAAEAVWGAVDR